MHAVDRVTGGGRSKRNLKERITMKRILSVMLPALVCFGGLAVAQDVSYNFDQGADFSKYKTYKWVEIKGATYPDQMVDKQIKSAIDAELAKKGLSRVESDEASLYLGYQIGLDKEKRVDTYDMGGGAWGYGGRWGGYGGGMSTSTTSTIHIGQLAIDMYDPAQKQIVWRGMGSKEINTQAKPEKKTKNLGKGVAKILKNYPPKKKA
jgi:hypothetical protein